MQDDTSLVYQDLNPDTILDAVETQGHHCDGHLLALNSYENRVYQIGVENADPLIAKFYRPGRWSNEEIQEEHDFTRALHEAEIPVVTPTPNDSDETLFHHGSYRFTLYPRRGGHAPELDNPDHLEQLGRFVARIHNVGALFPFQYRPTLNINGFGDDSRTFILGTDFIPPSLEEAYSSLTEDVLIAIRACFERAGDVVHLRLHGDNHPGNILCRDEAFHIVDFDDARMGPAIQDLWMFLSGDRDYMSKGLGDVLEGYTQFRDFNPAELNLIEALRALRQMHFSAWLARRWKDPAFPNAFPWFDSSRYWENHILELREQLAAMQEYPLTWIG
ncbi:MAG: serine/threonine protein kinase [Methylococcales bacterium]